MSNLEGQKAPPFNLAGSDGKKHSLADYAGKNVVLYFYPKAMTPGCTAEGDGLRDQFAAFQARGKCETPPPHQAGSGSARRSSAPAPRS